jgi:beta-ureidopropionase
VTAPVTGISRRGFAALAAAATGAPRPGARSLRAAAVTLEGLHANSYEEGLRTFLPRMDLAARSHPDLLCLPEFFLAAMLPSRLRFTDAAEPVPGPTTERIGAWARRHRCYVVCPLISRRGGSFFNTSVLLDRNGGIAGSYDKIHLSEREMERGGRCGPRRPCVLAADFGRIGLLTCFDANWPEEWAALRRLDADIVCWPSAYGGGPVRALACQNNYFVLTAPWRQPGTAELIDPAGDVVASGREVLASTVNLETAVYTVARNDAGLKKALKRHAGKLAARYLEAEDWCILESLVDGPRLNEVEAECGLVRRHKFVARCTRTQDSNREGTVPPL